jgi:hypothetical protein
MISPQALVLNGDCKNFAVPWSVAL